MKNQTKLIALIFKRGLEGIRKTDATRAVANRKIIAIIQENNGQFPESFMIRILTGKK